MKLLTDEQFVEDLSIYVNTLLKRVGNKVDDWPLEIIIYGLVIAAGRLVTTNQGVVDEEKLLDVFNESMIDQTAEIKKDFSNFN